MIKRAIVCAALAAPTAAFGGSLPAPESVTPVKVAEVAGYTEGVAIDAAGNIFMSDTQHGVVYKIAPDGTKTEWATGGAPNGHKLLADGTHLVCDGGAHAVLHYDPNGKLLGKASSECDGKALRAPNDICVDAKSGGFYFTDPGGSNAQNPIGTVHYVDAKGVTHLVAGGLAFPNGLLLTPDRKWLIVGESEYNHILAFPVLGPGKVGEKKEWAKLPEKSGDQIANAPDGMALDEKGNVWVAHYGMHSVQVLSPQGKLLRTYRAGPLTSSNVAFGGPKMDQLYVTGAIADEKSSAGTLFRLDLKGWRGRKLGPVK